MAPNTYTLLAILSATSLVSGFGTGCSESHLKKSADRPAVTTMPANLKVAFFGDQGVSTGSKKVLSAIKEWGADFVVHTGDFDYNNSPSSWDKQIDDVLGADYPYFSTIGNHDLIAWSGYSSRIEDRMSRLNLTSYCTGEAAVNMVCNYKGLHFVLSGVGTKGSKHDEFIDWAFSDYPAVWKVCNWHKNQRLYQTGSKVNEVGWEAYEVCRQHGAIVSTSHEHSYARSHLMSNFENTKINSTSNTLVLSPGNSFAFCSGLGGKSIRSWSAGLEKNPWWAATASSNNKVDYGALFCTFNVNGDLNKASCYFRDVSGKLFDSFQMVSNVYKTSSALVKQKQFYEVPIKVSEGDSHYHNGKKFVQEKILPLASDSGKSETTLRFKDLPPVFGKQTLSHVHLQVYGAETTSDVEKPFLRLRISSSFPGSTTEHSVYWTEEEEDWEAGSVWVSPDLGYYVQNLVDKNELRFGDEIIIKIDGVGNRQIHSFDSSACLAPTLTFEYGI